MLVTGYFQIHSLLDTFKVIWVQRKPWDGSLRAVHTEIERRKIVVRTHVYLSSELFLTMRWITRLKLCERLVVPQRHAYMLITVVMAQSSVFFFADFLPSPVIVGLAGDVLSPRRPVTSSVLRPTSSMSLVHVSFHLVFGRPILLFVMSAFSTPRINPALHLNKWHLDADRLGTMGRMYTVSIFELILTSENRHQALGNLLKQPRSLGNVTLHSSLDSAPSKPAWRPFLSSPRTFLCTCCPYMIIVSSVQIWQIYEVITLLALCAFVFGRVIPTSMVLAVSHLRLISCFRQWLSLRLSHDRRFFLPGDLMVGPGRSVIADPVGDYTESIATQLFVIVILLPPPIPGK